MKDNFDLTAMKGKSWGYEKTFKKLIEQRAKYGVCDMDSHGLAEYLTTVLYNGLELMIERKTSYPYDWSREAWYSTLNELKEKLEVLMHLNEEDEYERYLDNCDDMGASFILQNYRRVKEDYRDFLKNEILDELKEVWVDLW